MASLDLEFLRLPRPNRYGRSICFCCGVAPGWHFLILENTVSLQDSRGFSEDVLQGSLSCIFLFTSSKQLVSFLPLLQFPSSISDFLWILSSNGKSFYGTILWQHCELPILFPIILPVKGLIASLNLLSTVCLIRSFWSSHGVDITEQRKRVLDWAGPNMSWKKAKFLGFLLWFK